MLALTFPPSINDVPDPRLPAFPAPSITRTCVSTTFGDRTSNVLQNFFESDEEAEARLLRKNRRARR